jgi:DNA repair protein RadA
MSLKRTLEFARRRSLFSSGSASVDNLLDGGLKTGEMVEVYGASNTGKTQLAMQSTLSAVAEGHTAAFVDTEGTFRPERLAPMAEARGVDPDKALARVYSIRAEDTEQQVQAMEKIRKTPELSGCRMVVVDTVTKNFTLEYGGSRNAVRRQTLLSQYLNALVRDAYIEDRAVLLTNRVASVGIDANSTEVDIGGDTLRNSIQKVVHLRKSGGRIYLSRVDEDRPEVSSRITEAGFE